MEAQCPAQSKQFGIQNMVSLSSAPALTAEHEYLVKFIYYNLLAQIRSETRSLTGSTAAENMNYVQTFCQSRMSHEQFT